MGTHLLQQERDTPGEACGADHQVRREQGAVGTLVLQDPEIRKDFAWDTARVGGITAPTLPLWTDHDPTGGLDEAALLQS
ncbi:hypothetical protein AB0I51_17940 [Streptomyces sp. NPDC050549]|uniref:hypothetical protein n=1 Tax=Streptomyces sp. NPDC050549 TaxID=3155406 RepID=UPI0034410563